MIVLGLLRHGEVEGGDCFRGHQDDPLSPTGFDQMWTSVNDAQSWDRVISSPLKRCAEFADQISQQQAIPLEFDNDLMEMYFGEWEGRTAAELMQACPEQLSQFWQDPDQHPPPGGERLSIFEARVLRARDSILSQTGQQRILIVTHGGVIRVLLCHDQQRPMTELLDIEVKHGGLYTLYSGQN